MVDLGVLAQIKTIEFQLSILKARVAHAETAESAPKYLGDLCGLWAGLGPFNEEEIDDARYTLDKNLSEPDESAK